MTTRTVKKTTKPATKTAKAVYVATETHKGYAERAGLNAKGAQSAKPHVTKLARNYIRSRLR
jgi:hypothetical protein